MPSDPWFEICEQHAFTGSTSWRLKGGHIRYRGRDGRGEPHPAVQPVSAPKERIESFIVTLDFLDAWSWRSDYDPTDCGYVTMDGMSWTLTGSIAGRSINAGGQNAYPSFADASKSFMQHERYAFLVFSFHRSFRIPFPANAHELDS